MKKQKTWVVLANARSARFLENAGRGEGLVEMEERALAAAPPQPYSSEPSIGHSIAGPGINATDPGDPQELANLRFAREVAQALSAAHSAGSFDRLVIAAGPKMLGLLRKALDTKLRALVAAEFDNDLTAVTADELESRLGEAVAF